MTTLTQRIAALESILAAHKSTYDSHLEMLELLKGEVWPKAGDVYCTIDSSGDIGQCEWVADRIDLHKSATGNCHHTVQEAQAYKKWLTSPRTHARRRVEMCEGFDSLIGGYEVYSIGGSISIITKDPDLSWGSFAFTTKQQAQSCIDTLGEDVIKCALGVVN
jgi:hypothetical protein